MSLEGKAIDWVEAVATAMDDPEARPAGYAEPFYTVSAEVAVSRDHGFYVYHLRDDQLGQGSSLGNSCAWAETKGFGQLLNLFCIETGVTVTGGMSLTYLVPFSDLAAYSVTPAGAARAEHHAFSRETPSSIGKVHLHPAFQQHEFVIGDGLHVLETFFVPRTGMDDPCAAVQTVMLWNRTTYPISITVVGSLSMRGGTPMDMVAQYDRSRGAIVAWNKSHPDWVRVFGGSQVPKGYWATNDEEEAYSPKAPLPNLVNETGDLVGALQYDMLLMPNQRHKLRKVVAFSPHGRKAAEKSFDACSTDHMLKRTSQHYWDMVNRAVVEMPDDVLTHGIQWAKTCLIRPLCKYNVGEAFTNDPGHSSNLVGRDTAWYVYGCDLVQPDAACSMLRIFRDHQRKDGLIPEYVDGRTGESEDHGFNINDDTPLYLMAISHHIKATGHWKCLETLYESARKAGELILASRAENGLVRCTADGMGVEGICGWRNVLQNERITGMVTEVNSECYAALLSLSDLAEMRGLRDDSARYREEAERLKAAINAHLINHENGLYVRNIDLSGRKSTQVTSDLIFPLICGVADDSTTQEVVARLASRDFMTDAGIRVLPTGNPRYDPSFESGCLGGVWPGVTWWYAMSASRTEPKMLAESLRRAYEHYVSDPKVYNTVPGQFSEWSDGQTLVNRGMRLSPWESPRFIWAAIEGLAGVRLGLDSVALDPQLPPDWLWLCVRNVPYRGGWLSYFLAREYDGMHLYTANSFETNLIQHHYKETVEGGVESITTGISAAVFRKEGEVLICLGNNQPALTVGPLLIYHAIDVRKRYDVSHLNSHEGMWKDIGVLKGADLMRIAVRIEGRGYALYKFTERK